MEYATTSWAITSNANKSKLDKVQNVVLRGIVGAMKATSIKEMGWRREQTWSPWNSEEHLKFLPRQRRSGDYLEIRSTKSWLLQPKIG